MPPAVADREVQRDRFRRCFVCRILALLSSLRGQFRQENVRQAEVSRAGFAATAFRKLQIRLNFLRVGLRIIQRHLDQRWRTVHVFCRRRHFAGIVFDQFHNQPNRPARAGEVSNPARRSIPKFYRRKTAAPHSLGNVACGDCARGNSFPARVGLETSFLGSGDPHGYGFIFCRPCNTMCTIAFMAGARKLHAQS